MGIFDWKHWLVILIVVILVFGTKRLKNLGSDLGETIKGFRKAMNSEDSTPEQPKQPEAAQPSQQQTIDAQAQRVEQPNEQPARKD